MAHQEIALHCLGGGGEVGRSSFVLDYGERVLLDHGVKLHTDSTQYPLPLNLNLDAGIISHAHLDHSGNFPHLFRGTHCMTYLTPPTLELAKLLWFDTLKIAGLEGMDANFSKEEISRADKYAFPCNYNKPLQVARHTSLEFFDAGHIVGSALAKLDFHGKSLVYSGDFKDTGTRLHDEADLSFGEVDYLVMETTYGDREHPDRKKTEKAFLKTIEETLEGEGWAVIAAFAVGRSQEMLDIVYEAGFDVPIYLDGMCKAASEIYLRYPHYLKDVNFLKKALHHAVWVKDHSVRRKALNNPAIVITTSGMLQGGPAMFYLKNLHHDKHSSIILTGYQAEESPGRKLEETGFIEIDGERLKVEMRLEHYDFSAHAGHKGLLDSVKKLNPEKVVLIHGDGQVIHRFKAELEGEGFHVLAPHVGDKVVLNENE